MTFYWNTIINFRAHTFCAHYMDRRATAHRLA